MVSRLKEYLKEIEANNKKGKKINAILEINPIDNKKNGLLSGKVIVVKANINVKGLYVSCGSKVLENYQAPYDATVIKKIKDEGGIILGIANCDEFACGSSGETSAFGPTQNPIVPGFVPGGSSSGSVAAVAAGFCDMALGSDTGGSVRNPASHCGVVGIKPTYSSVSRYGLIDMCMSFDQIGPITKNVSDAALLLSVIQGKDKCDAISLDGTPQAYTPGGHTQRAREPLRGENLLRGPEKSSTNIFTKGKINLDNIDKVPKNLKVGLLDFPISDKRIQKIIEDKVEEARREYGWKVEKIKIPYLDLAIATYYPIVYVEFFSATRRFDGRRYGKKIEEVCGPEVLRRILGGSEIAKAEHEGRYYNQALKVRKLLQKEFEKVFKKVDCIISPVVPKLPHKIGEKISIEEMFQYDALTCPINLVGNCAMSLPVGKINGVPVGMHISCDNFDDELMLRIVRGIEKI